MLYFTIGLPRSGKSTHARKWLEWDTDINSGVFEKRHTTDEDAAFGVIMKKPRVIICADVIRKTLTGQRFYGPAEDMVHGVKHIMIRAYLAEGYDVLVDGTHTKMDHIETLMWMEPEAVPIWIYPREEIACNTQGWGGHIGMCKTRAIKTNQKDLLPVIGRMGTQLEQLAHNWNIWYPKAYQKITKAKE